VQEFDPWGTVRSGASSATQRNYTGQYLDGTGLLFYNARYYDPVLARFISADSIIPGAGALTLAPLDSVATSAWSSGGGGPANPQDLNRYAYGLNNPLRYTDPTGHCAGWLWGAADCQFVGGDTSRWDYAGAADAVQTSLDVVGMVPVVGEVADGANAAISAARGDVAGAALSMAAMVPGAGSGATAAKLATRYGDEVAGAAKLADESIPGIIYREGDPNPGNLTPRAVDEGNLSFRDSLSNPVPLAAGQRPVLRPGEKYFGIDTSQLPKGSVVYDNVPPGHVSVRGVPPHVLKAAVVERGKFPK
jgi:RHS repeat-associated protein